MGEDTMKKGGLMKAVQRHIGTAAADVQNEGAEQLRRMQKSQNVQQQHLHQYWNQQNTTSNTTATWAGGLLNQVTSGTLTVPVQQQIFNQAGYTQTVYSQLQPTLEFTDAERDTFMAKLAELLTKGWECLRCRRIWAPQINGCEFCNFIDRLEGKDVDEDDSEPAPPVRGKC